MRVPHHSHFARPLGFLVAASLFLAQPGSAQRIERGWQPSPPHLQLNARPGSTTRPALPATAFADSSAIPPTHWFEGAAIGGVIGGVAGAILAVDLCNYDSPCHRPVLAGVGGGLVLGVIGFGVGALIGGQFPKP
jgi:hypothetical protein